MPEATSKAKIIYNGISTEALILASSATVLLNQTWWAQDKQRAYKAITNLSTANVWQAVMLEYDASTDSYCLTPTQDGQTQNIGRENFFLAINNNGVGATALDPKVFLSSGSEVGDEVFQDCFKVIASDISEGALFGLNTTALAVGDKGKISSWGTISGVNTSAWSSGDILYVDPAIAGDLTNVQPDINAFVVGTVSKSHATEGIIFVNTISSIRIDKALIPIGVDRIFFTGETEVTTEDTFYVALREDEGSVPEATEVIVCPDDSIVGIGQDHLGVVLTEPTLAVQGLRDGQIETTINQSGGNEKLYIELYDSDDQGVPIDSGILTEPVGDLGVRPVMTMVSSLLNMDTTDPFYIEVRGLLSEDYTFPTGNRIRAHILAEKIGTAGSNKTFTIYFGSDHDTYISTLSVIEIEDVAGLPEALDLGLKAGGNWIDGTNLKNTVYRENGFTGWPLLDTVEHLAPQDVGSPEDSIDTSTFPTASDTSAVRMVHKFTITEECYSKAFQVMAPNWDTDVVSKVTFFNVTQSTFQTVDNPILIAGEFVILSVDQVFFGVGDLIEIWFEFYNSTAASAIDGGWTSNVAVGLPLSQEFNINNVVTPTVLEISHTDLDSNDRSTELDGVVPGSIVRINETGDVGRNVEFTVDTVDTTALSSTKYTVLPGSVTNGPSNIRDARTCTVHIDIPISQPSVYGVKAGYYPAGNPSWATITTELYYDGVLQAGTVDGFPINLICQKAFISDDWFIMAVSG